MTAILYEDLTMLNIDVLSEDLKQISNRQICYMTHTKNLGTKGLQDFNKCLLLYEFIILNAFYHIMFCIISVYLQNTLMI